MEDYSMTRIRRILLPTDYSDLARNAAVYARSLAEMYGATLHVVHVLERVPAAVPGPEVSGVALAVPGPEALAAAQETTSRFVQDHLGGLDVSVVTRVLEGAPYVQIARYAAKASIDLIVIGTHARGVVKRIFLGSTSKSVLEYAPCPVLMVPMVAAEPAYNSSGAAGVQPVEVSR
jgi:nucleotide-binding universal stress UspA family protein